MKKLIIGLLTFGSLSAIAQQTINLQPGSVATIFPNEMTTVTCSGSGSSPSVFKACYCKDELYGRVELRRKLISTSGTVISDDRLALFDSGDVQTDCAKQVIDNLQCKNP